LRFVAVCVDESVWKDDEVEIRVSNILSSPSRWPKQGKIHSTTVLWRLEKVINRKRFETMTSKLWTVKFRCGPVVQKREPAFLNALFALNVKQVNLVASIAWTQ
jgi:hypothetical protein